VAGSDRGKFRQQKLKKVVENIGEILRMSQRAYPYNTDEEWHNIIVTPAVRRLSIYNLKAAQRLMKPRKTV